VDDEAIERALLERIAVGDEALRLLAEQRARYAKERIVSSGIAAERVFIVTELPTDDKAKERSASRADFALK
jgi:hypothetical protein